MVEMPHLEEAKLFVNEVKLVFWNHPQVYNEFLMIMRNIQHQDEEEILESIFRVVELFGNHTDLIIGFHNFLPSECTLMAYELLEYEILW